MYESVTTKEVLGIHRHNGKGDLHMELCLQIYVGHLLKETLVVFSICMTKKNDSSQRNFNKLLCCAKSCDSLILLVTLGG